MKNSESEGQRERVGVCVSARRSSHVFGFTYLTPHCCTICNEEFLRQKKRETERKRERESVCVYTCISKYISKSKEPYLVLSKSLDYMYIYTHKETNRYFQV